MSFEAFSNNSVKIKDNQADSVICGKIVLKTKEWEISYTCDFCEKSLSTLPNLLEHVFNSHIKDVPDKKFSELFGIDFKHDDDLEYEAEMGSHQEVFNRRNQQKINAGDISDSQQHLNDTSIKDVDDNKHSRTNENSREVNDVDSTESDAKFEFLSVSEKYEIVEEKPRQKCLYKRWICDKCNRKFPNLGRLKLHQKFYCDQPNICIDCGAVFKDRYSLKIHYNRHNGIKPYMCKVCKKTFTTKNEFNLHMRQHTGERPFECAECNKSFVTSSSLCIHQRRHMNEFLYLCQTCGRTFSTSTLLHDHISTHSTERPHECTKCNAKFANRKGLRQHMEIHADVRKHVCKLCGKSFAQPAGVYSHMKIVHKNKIKN